METGKLHALALEKAVNGYAIHFASLSEMLNLHKDAIKGTALESKTLGEFFRLAAANGLGVDEFEKLQFEFNGDAIEESKVVDMLKDCWLEKDGVKKFTIVRTSILRRAIEAAEKEAAKASAEDNEKELLKKWREAEWFNISDAVNSIMETLTTLYKSGFQSLPQSGLLVDTGNGESPLVCVKSNKVKNEELGIMEDKTTIENRKDSGFMYDLSIMSALKDSLGNMAPYNIDKERHTKFPSLAQLRAGSGVLAEAHLAFQTANFVISGANDDKNSIKKWIRETKLNGEGSADDWLKSNNKNKQRLSNWKDVEKWYRWVLENTIYRYFIEAGIKPDDDAATIVPVINEIKTLFAARMRNVVVVSERVSENKQMQTTELRVCTNNNYDKEQLAEQMAKKLNVGIATDIVVTSRPIDSLVTIFKIVYDKKAASGNLYAYQILNTLIESGTEFNWDNVLLGKTETGDFKFWTQFKAGETAADRAYTIYAGSGSGKGNMTLNLLASAVMDDCQIFYTDGKPDSAMALANEAWPNGYELYAFDGQPESKSTYAPGYLETYARTKDGRQLRNSNDVFAFKDTIPKGIFNEQTSREFLGVSRYLRSLHLCLTMITARTENQIPKDKWNVWIFDEMTKISDYELHVREAFYTYFTNMGYGFGKAAKDKYLVGFKKNKEFNEILKRDSEKFDPIAAYIKDWIDWADSLGSLIQTAVSMSFRMADTNIIFIFQNAKWCGDAGTDNPDTHYPITAISKMARDFKSIKFVGRDALTYRCGDYGNGFAMNASWYKDRVNKEGWWAVSSGTTVGADNMTLFKPYSIWGYAGVKPAAGKEDHYFTYYINELKKALGGPAVGETLQSAWDYANSAVEILGKAGKIEVPESVVTGELRTKANLTDYMYNVGSFTIKHEKFDPKDLVNEEDADTAGYSDTADNSFISDLNSDIEGEPVSGEPTRVESTTYTEYDDSFGAEDVSRAEEPDDAEFIEDEDFESGEVTEPVDEEYSDAFSVEDVDDMDFEDAEPVESVNNTYEDDDLTPIVKKGKDMQWGVDASGRQVIDTTKVGHGTTTKPLDRSRESGNFIVCDRTPFTSKQLEKAFNNEKAYNRLMTTAFNVLIADIAKEAGGRMSVKQLTVLSDRIIVNAKLVKHRMFDDERMNIADMLDFGELLSYFSNISVLNLDTDTCAVLDEQITYCITEEDAANGINDAIDYILRHRAKLNTVRVKAVGTDKMLDERRKADLLAKKRKEHLASVRERANQQTKRELDSCFKAAKKQRGIKIQPERKLSPKSTAKKIKSTGRGFLGGIGRLFGSFINLGRGSFMR